MVFNKDHTLPPPFAWRFHPELHKHTHLTPEQYRENVRIELEQLINTKRYWSEKHDLHTTNSVWSYGLNTAVAMGVRSNNKIAHISDCIKQSIMAHEPRLTNVHVMVNHENNLDGYLSFTILADLAFFPSLPTICYESKLNTATQTISLAKGYPL